MPVKGIAIVLVAVLTVPNTSVALDQPITARILTATFMAVHADDIILTPNRAKKKKKKCMPLTVMLPSATLADGLAPVVQTLNSAIHGIKHLFSGYVFIK